MFPATTAKFVVKYQLIYSNETFFFVEIVKKWSGGQVARWWQDQDTSYLAHLLVSSLSPLQPTFYTCLKR